MSSALRSSVVSRRGAPPGATIAAGCGSKVTTVSAPRMTSRWPRWTPSKVPTAIRRGRGCDLGERGHLHPRNPTTGFSRPSSRGSAMATGPSASASRTCSRLGLAGDAPGRGRRATPRRRRPRTRGRKASACSSGRTRCGSASCDVEGPDARAPQLLAVAVAQLGDERAHVGPGRALDEELRAVLLAPAAARSGRRRPRARAPRTPRRRARARRPCGPARGRPSRSAGAGRCARSAATTSARRDAPGVRDLALRVAGGRDRAQPRDGDVLLGQRHQEALHAARAADEDEQQSRRERVQRAGVAGLAHARAAAAWRA